MYTGLEHFPDCVVLYTSFTDLCKCDSVTYVYILKTIEDSINMQNSLWNDEWQGPDKLRTLSKTIETLHLILLW